MTERIRRGEEWVPRLKFQDAIKMEIQDNEDIPRFVNPEAGQFSNYTVM